MNPVKTARPGLLVPKLVLGGFLILLLSWLGFMASYISRQAHRPRTPTDSALLSASAPNRPRLRWADFAAKPDEWFGCTVARDIAENILSHQSAQGSWPKNIDTFGTRYAGDPTALRGTFDNGATVGECRFLGRLLQAAPLPRYEAALLKAVDLLLDAQYPTGGWPQAYPPGPGYARHITFNDGTMVNLLELLRDAARSPEFRRIDPRRREEAGRAVERGIRCVLRCQIRRGDRLTVWCAQHDEVTLEPRKGRAYEHPSLSGAESAEIVRFLMNVEAPGSEVIQAINSACLWYEESKLVGIRQIRRDGDKVLVQDQAAPPLWARFYDLRSNRPVFSGRDGVIRYDMAEIEAERRNGYAWYGDWGRQVLGDWAAWKRRLNVQ